MVRTKKSNVLSMFLMFMHKFMIDGLKECPHAGHGLSLPQMKAMHIVFLGKKSSMKEVADALHITPPSVTSLVNSLVKMGFIKRVHDRKDRRQVILSISPSGMKMLRKAFRFMEVRMEDIIKHLSKEDKSHLVRIMTLLLKYQK